MKIFDRVAFRFGQGEFSGTFPPKLSPSVQGTGGTERHLILDEGFVLCGKPLPHGNPVRCTNSRDVETLRMICGARE